MSAATAPLLLPPFIPSQDPQVVLNAPPKGSTDVPESTQSACYANMVCLSLKTLGEQLGERPVKSGLSLPRTPVVVLLSFFF